MDEPATPAATVPLTQTDRTLAAELAAQSARTYTGARGWYVSNSPARHLTGRLGEVAAAAWFTRHGHHVHQLFRDPARDRDADLTLTLPYTSPPAPDPWATGPVDAGPVAVEVKSVRARFHDDLGRSVAARQLTRVLTKADAIVWCRVPDDTDPTHVDLVGWVPPWDFLRHARPVWRPGLRADAQLPAGALRPIDELADPATIRDLVPDRLPDSLVNLTGSDCGHTDLLGLCWGCVRPVERDAPDQVLVSDGTGLRFHVAERTQLEAAHGGWPFDSRTQLVPLSTAVLHYDQCPLCFPR